MCDIPKYSHKEISDAISIFGKVQNEKASSHLIKIISMAKTDNWEGIANYISLHLHEKNNDLMAIIAPIICVGAKDFMTFLVKG